MALGSVLDNPGVFSDIGKRYAFLGVVLEQLCIVGGSVASVENVELRALTLVMTSRASGETLAGILRSTRAMRLYVAADECE